MVGYFVLECFILLLSSILAEKVWQRRDGQGGAKVGITSKKLELISLVRPEKNVKGWGGRFGKSCGAGLRVLVEACLWVGKDEEFGGRISLQFPVESEDKYLPLKKNLLCARLSQYGALGKPRPKAQRAAVWLG